MDGLGRPKRRHDDDMSYNDDFMTKASGLAALSVCEALLLTLVKEGLVSHENACDAIDDAIASHSGATAAGGDADVHRKAASLAESIKRTVRALPRGGGAQGG